MDLKVEKLEVVTHEGLPVYNRFDENRFYLSQSTMKMHAQWANKGLCGIVYREVLLGNLRQPSSEESRKGQYFEYLCTGAAPAHGDPIPTPETYKRDSNVNEPPFKKGDLKADWQHIVEQKNNFHDYCKLLGFKLIQAGVKMKREGASGNLDCIFQVEREKWEDLLSIYHVENFDTISVQHITEDQPRWEDCVWVDPLTGERHQGCIIVDLKFSGMLYEKWNDASWNLERLPDDEGKIVQAKHYHWLSGGLPFFFWVFSSTEIDNRLIRIYFEANAIDRHVNHRENGVVNIRKVIVNAMKQDTRDVPAFLAKPSIRQCGHCPIRGGCNHRSKVPLVFGVHVS